MLCCLLVSYVLFFVLISFTFCLFVYSFVCFLFVFILHKFLCLTPKQVGKLEIDEQMASEIAQGFNRKTGAKQPLSPKSNDVKSTKSILKDEEEVCFLFCFLNQWKQML